MTRVDLDFEAIRALGRLGGAGADAARNHSEDVQRRARDAAPVDTGQLREHIVIRDGEDDRGAYFDVVTGVHRKRGADGVGFPYGTLQEERDPYLRPAIGVG